MSRVCWTLSEGSLGSHQSRFWRHLQLSIPIQSLHHSCRKNKLCREAAIPGASYCEWELGLSAGGVERSLPKDPRRLDLDLDLDRSPTPVEVQY
jgi:hypothetical protein